MLETLRKQTFKLQEVDFSCVLYVYKSKNGSWRGFAHPYDVTIEAPTKTKTLSALREMVAEYEEGLIKYDYPAHLTTRPLSDTEDNERFNTLAFDSRYA